MRRALLFILALTLYNIQCSSGQGVDKPRYQIVTNRAGSYLGTINIELFPLITPQAVRNFDSLVNMQFFDSTAFHRVVPGFVIQGGDPNTINGPMSTWGQGQPWQQNIPAEFSVVRHLRGIIGAARDVDTNSANSQFYICVANALSLDGNYTVFGKVTSGMNIVDTIVNSPRNAQYIPLQKIEMFVTSTGVNDTIPAIPSLVFPASNGTGILNGNSFQWSNVDGAVLYTIEISSDTLFSSIVFGRNAGLNSTGVSLLQPNTIYYWRVKSNNGGHESAFSSYSTFTTAFPAPLVYPADSAVNIPINPTMDWDPVPGANSYRLQIATSDTFSTPTLVLNQGGITTTSRQVTLSPNTQYYWRVTFISSGSQGFYSEVRSFTTGTSVGINEQNQETLFISNIYPNPATQNLNVELAIRKPASIQLSIKNMLGENVYSRMVNADSFNSTFNIDISSFSEGSYLLYINSPEGDNVRQFEIK